MKNPMPQRDRILRSVSDIECWISISRRKTNKKPLTLEEIDKMEYPKLSEDNKQYFSNEIVWILLQQIRDILNEK